MLTLTPLARLSIFRSFVRPKLEYGLPIAAAVLGPSWAGSPGLARITAITNQAATWCVGSALNSNRAAVARTTVSYTHLRAHETGRNLVCRLLLEKKKK